MIRRDGDRMRVEGAVTLANVGAVLDAGRRHIADGVRVVDFGAVTELDSSLLAALLGWMRDARGASGDVRFENLPEGLTTLAKLYGVDGLLTGASGPAH